jgi:hypothetical protein
MNRWSFCAYSLFIRCNMGICPYDYDDAGPSLHVRVQHCDDPTMIFRRVPVIGT